MDLDTPCRIAGAILLGAAACAVAWSAPAAHAAARTLVVEAGPSARAHVPMSVEAPEGTAKARMLDGQKEVPCQVAEGRLWWILDALDPGATRTYTVELGADGAGDPKAVDLRRTDQAIDILIDGRPFTTYHFTNPKHCGQQTRRPYFFPVLGPGGTPMTRPYPLTDDPIPENVAKDHPHHTSVWVAHGDVNGTDNWSIDEKAGWQLHRDFQAVASGPVVGWFRETLDWTTADRKPNLAEVRTVRVWRLPEAARMLDLEIALAAKYGKVTFGDTKEGGLCATRMRPEFRADRGGRLVNSEGQTADATWGKPAAWVDCSGPVEGRRLGYALFDAPGNPWHPTPWHARTYGLLTANPFGLSAFDPKGGRKGDWTLEADRTATVRYRLYFHPGDEKEADVAARWADYAQPPTARWK